MVTSAHPECLVKLLLSYGACRFGNLSVNLCSIQPLYSSGEPPHTKVDPVQNIVLTSGTSLSDEDLLVILTKYTKN